jgi:nucleotide-binding universal stress UspA family protein
MVKKILAPVDGSKRAEKILPYIEELALRHEATVIFLQVVEPALNIAAPYDGGAYVDYERSNQLLAEAKAYLNCLVGELREKGAAAKAIVDYGPVVRAILDVAEREQVDLIALASHGRTGLSRVFYGSVAAGLLQQADRPLLLIRAKDD